MQSGRRPHPDMLKSNYVMGAFATELTSPLYFWIYISEIYLSTRVQLWLAQAGGRFVETLENGGTRLGPLGEIL